MFCIAGDYGKQNTNQFLKMQVDIWGGFGVKDTGYWIRDTGFGIRDTGYGIADNKCLPTAGSKLPINYNVIYKKAFVLE
jgi:hypothetical protein